MRSPHRLGKGRISRERSGGISRYIVARALAVAGVFVVLVGAGLSLFGAVPAVAATGINNEINFQGKLVNTDGTNIANGNYNVEFKLYTNGDGTAAGDTGGSGGALQWTEDYLNHASQGVTVTNGIFQVNLGSITTLPAIFNNDTIWLSINLGNTSTICTTFSGCGGDGEMLPMIRFTSAPYALNSQELGGLTASQFGQLQTGTPAAQTGTLDVSGNLIAATSVQAPLVDTSTAVGLSIGTGMASSVTIGQTTTPFTIQGNSTSKLTATSGSFTTTVGFAAPSANQTLTFAAESGAQTICTTTAATCSGTYAAATATGYLAKNATDTSTVTGAAVTAGNYLYGFTNNSTTTSGGVLSLANSDSNTGNTLYVTANGNPATSTNALIVANNTNGTPAGNLIDLQNNGANELSVDYNGNVTQNGGTGTTDTVNGQTISAAANFTGTVTAATSVLTPLLDTASAGVLAVGTTHATAIDLNQNTVVASGKTVAIQGNTSVTTNSATALTVGSGTTNDSALANFDTTGNSNDLVTNGSFETNTTGWASKGGAGLTSSSTNHLYGADSMQIATTGASQGAMYPVTLTAGQEYSIGIAVDTSSSITAANFAVGYANDGSTETNYVTSATAIPAGSWTHIYYSFTPATVTGTPYIFIKQLDGVTRNIYIDGVDLEATSSTTQQQYREGNISLFGTITSPFDIQPVTNNTNAFDVSNNLGQELLGVDTVNNAVLIGTATGSGKLTVVSSGTPTAISVNSNSTGDGEDMTLTNTSGTQADGISINRNGTGGTTTNALVVTNTLGTTTTGLQLTQTGGTFTTGINFTGTFGNLIVAPNFSVANSGLIQGTGGATITGTTQLNATTGGATTIGSSVGGIVSIASDAASSFAVSGNTLALSGTNFSIGTSGVLTLAGGQNPDITTPGAGTATNLALQPGTSSGASSNGPALLLTGGNASGATTVIGGAVTIQGGNATAGSGSRTGGSVGIDAGTGASANGSVSIAGTNAISLSLGRSGITTTNNGALTSTQLLTANGGITIAANQAVTMSNGTGVFTQSYTAATASSAHIISVTNNNSGAGITMQGVNITPTNATAASSGTNLLNALNFAAGTTLLASDNTNGINFASATGYTNFINTPTAILTSGGALTGLTGVTLTSGNVTTPGNITTSGTGAISSATTVTGVTLDATTNFSANGTTGAAVTCGAGQTNIAATYTEGLLTGAGTCTTVAVAGNYLIQAPTTNSGVGSNDIQPATTGITGLTVNGTSAGTAAVALVVAQNYAADAEDVNVTGAGQTNGILVNRTNAGTLTNGIQIENTSGTVTNGLTFTGTFGNDVISAPAFSVTNAGAITGVGVNSGTGLIQGSGGETVTGTEQINATTGGTTNIGSSVSGAVTIGANAASAFTTTTGALTLTSAAATTWSTTAGLLTVNGAGGVTVASSNTTGASSNVQLVSGNSTTSGSTGTVQVQSGNVTASGTAGTVSVDTGSGSTTGTPTVNIGTANATAVNVGRSAGTLSLQGTTVTVGAAGASLLQNNGATANTVCSYAITAATTLNTAGKTVNGCTAFDLTVTGAGPWAITVPAPTAGAGSIIYVSNIAASTTTVTLLGNTLNIGSTASLVYNGTAWTFAGADASTLQSVYNASGATSPQISLTSSGEGVVIDDNGTPIGGTLFGVGSSAFTYASASSAAYLAVTSTTIDSSDNLAFTGVAGSATPYSITVGTQPTAATAGQALDVTAAAGNTSGTGGNLALAAGAGGTSGIGGIASLTGGAAGGGNTAGGAATVQGGAATGTGTGGTASLLGGAANPTAGSSSFGGVVAVTGGTGSTGSGATAGAHGGAVAVTGGAGGAGTGTNSSGGAGALTTVAGGAGGLATGTGTGGAGANVQISGGAGGNTSATGTNGSGGNITLTAGAAGTGGSGGTAGAINLQAGAINVGTVGASILQNNGATANAVCSYAITAATTLNTAGKTVDGCTAFDLTATGAGPWAITVPSPAAGAGSIIYISNIAASTTTVTLLGNTLNIGSTASLVYNGTAWTFAGADASNLQSVYNASGTTNPQITLLNADGGVKIADAASSTITNLLQIGNNANTVNYLAVTSAAINTADNLAFTGVAGSATPYSITVGTQPTAATAGQALDVTAAAGNTSGTGGNLALAAGAGGTSGIGGAATLFGGSAGGGNTAGGAATVEGGAATGTGTGGQLTLQGGTAGPTTLGTGGAVNIQGGQGSAATAGGAGGTVTINAGDGTGTGNNSGGNINLSPGIATGSGTPGVVTVESGTNSATAFAIQTATAGSVLNIDDKNGNGCAEIGLQATATSGSYATCAGQSNGNGTLIINSGTQYYSGLAFAQLNDTDVNTTNTTDYGQLLGIDANGNVGISNAAVSLTSPALAYWDGKNDPTSGPACFPATCANGYAYPTPTATGAATFVSSALGERLTTTTATTTGSLNWSFAQVPFEEVQFQFQSGGGTGADATWFYSYANAVPTTEYGSGMTAGYVVYFDEYWDCIGVTYGGFSDGNQCKSGGGTNPLASYAFSNGNGGTTHYTADAVDDGLWHNVDIQFFYNQIVVRWDGQIVIDYSDVYGRNLGYQDFGFGARNGSAYNNHYIKGLLVTKLGTNTSQYDVNNANAPLASNLYWDNGFNSSNTTMNQGALGVGTADPTATLEVDGTTQLSTIVEQSSATATVCQSNGFNCTSTTAGTDVFGTGTSFVTSGVAVGDKITFYNGNSTTVASVVNNTELTVAGSELENSNNTQPGVGFTIYRPTLSTVLNSVQVGSGTGSNLNPTLLSLDSYSGTAGADPSGGTSGDMYFNSTSNQFRCFIASWQPCNGIWQTLMKTADSTKTSTTTFAADATLQFAMAASTNYSIRCQLYFGSTSATPGFKWEVTGPATPTDVSISHGAIPGGEADTNAAWADVAVNTSASQSNSVAAIAAGDGSLTLNTQWQNGTTAGTWAFQWAQNTTSTTATALRAGSYCDYVAGD